MELFYEGQKVEARGPFRPFRNRHLHSALWPTRDDLSLFEQNNPVEARKLTATRWMDENKRHFDLDYHGWFP